MTITQKAKDVIWSTVEVKKTDVKTSNHTKTIIYDFGSDLDEYRFLVEYWVLKGAGYGWQRKTMFWSDEKALEDILS